MDRDSESTLSPIELTQPIRPRRPKPSKPAATRGFAERLALFVTGVDRGNSEALLEGLTGVTHRRAIEFAREARTWDSATRQGRMALTFGNHAHAGDRLTQLMAQASPALRSAIFQRLAPWQRSLFLQVQFESSAAPCPAMDGLAERLIREATR